MAAAAVAHAGYFGYGHLGYNAPHLGYAAAPVAYAAPYAKAAHAVDYYVSNLIKYVILYLF